MAVYIVIGDSEVAPGAPVTTSLMTRLRDNAIAYWGAPIGTIALAGQTAAPTGWTKLTNHDDKALRVVSGTVGSGGSSPFSTVFAKTATDNVTLATGNLPSHSHPIGGSTSAGTTHAHEIIGYTGTGAGNNGPVATANGANALTLNTQGENNHTHPLPSATSTTGSGNPFTAPIDIRVQYVDVIRIQKD